MILAGLLAHSRFETFPAPGASGYFSKRLAEFTAAGTAPKFHRIPSYPTEAGYQISVTKMGIFFFENQQFFAKWVKPSFSREPWCSYMLSLASRPASLIVLIGMGTIYFFS